MRFAPSPTGYLHAGNLRTAIYNWLMAQKLGGEFILRLDDTDQARSTEAYADAIIEDLAWLGIRPSQVLRQSEHFGRYEEVKADLIKAGRIYPCFETPEELGGKRKRQIARGLPPVYDRSALALTPEEIEAKIAGGERPHWRFQLSGQRARMNDAIRGPVEINLGTLSDPVVQRADGTWLYVMTSVIDDFDAGITNIVRGDDHVTNSLAQVDMFEALGAQPPEFAHHNLLIRADGEGLSKRKGDLSLRTLRETGTEPMALASLVCLIGTADPVILHKSMDDLAASFSFSKVSKSPARFDTEELQRLSQRAIRGYAFADVAPRLEAMGLSVDEKVWHTFRDNLTRLDDIRDLMKLLDPNFMPGKLPEQNALLQAALETLPEAPWDESTWKTWTQAVAGATGLKGAGLFKPLRLALTGAEQGPELAKLLPLLGRELVQKRLQAAEP